jgi:hypothetical protein
MLALGTDWKMPKLGPDFPEDQKILIVLCACLKLEALERLRGCKQAQLTADKLPRPGADTTTAFHPLRFVPYPLRDSPRIFHRLLVFTGWGPF